MNYLKIKMNTSTTCILWLTVLLVFQWILVEKSVFAGAKKKTSNNLFQNFANLPLSFESNHGQANSQVKFLSRAKGYNLFLTSKGTTLVLHKPMPTKLINLTKTKNSPEHDQQKSWETAIVRFELIGANTSSKASGLNKLPGKINYFRGNDPKKWRINIPHYAKVRYEAVYPGIDLVYYGNQCQLEYDFVIAPGADYKAIRLAFQGIEKRSLDAEGNLSMKINGGKVTQYAPRVYQDVDGKKEAIDARYVVNGKGEVSFQVAAYDTKRPLVIDPILSYSTYLGGSDSDWGFGVAVDEAGNAYITGGTQSLDFPLTEDALQPIFGGGFCECSTGGDAFVSKFNSEGSELIYSTYLGGSEGKEAGDDGTVIAVDNSGCAYILGTTCSTDFPTTPGAFQVTPLEPSNFLTKLSPDGNALVYSTYLFSGVSDKDMAIDSNGNAYVQARSRIIKLNPNVA